MTIQARVIALGQPAAGDDAVGLAVLEELHRRGVPADVELMGVREATALIPLLETPATVVLVDAAVGEPPGEVVELGPATLLEAAGVSLSGHGIGVGTAIELARQLWAERASPSIRIVAVTIARPDRWRQGLSPVVAAAVRPAADKVLELVTA